MKRLSQTGDATRTDLAYIRTGLALWGMAILIYQQPKHKSWVVFFTLGVLSMWRARASVF